MLKWLCLTALVSLLHQPAFSQQLLLGKTPSLLRKSAVLELNSDKQGLLLSRITDTSLINALNPPDGMLIFYASAGQLMIRSGGYWQALSNTAALNNYWSVDGNTNGTVQRLGTLDNNDLPFVTNNTERLRLTASGSVGVGTSSPNSSTKLDVDGAVKLGTSGSIINNVLAFEYLFASSFLVGGGVAGLGWYSTNSTDLFITLPAALNGPRATVSVSPNFDLPAGVSIASAYAVNSTTIKVRLLNASTATGIISPGAKLYITVTDF
jgi:hypothetical protein